MPKRHLPPKNHPWKNAPLSPPKKELSVIYGYKSEKALSEYRKHSKYPKTKTTLIGG